jgi:hypothetical protein
MGLDRPCLYPLVINPKTAKRPPPFIEQGIERPSAHTGLCVIVVKRFIWDRASKPPPVRRHSEIKAQPPACEALGNHKAPERPQTSLPRASLRLGPLG